MGEVAVDPVGLIYDSCVFVCFFFCIYTVSFLVVFSGISKDDEPPTATMEQEKRMRREIANSNERRRMQSINNGFQSLRSLLPHHEGEKLSKVRWRAVNITSGARICIILRARPGIENVPEWLIFLSDYCVFSFRPQLDWNVKSCAPCRQ